MVIATGLDSGTIYQWSTTVTEGWSAFAPDFIEIDENLVYEEREDEFDIVRDFHFLLVNVRLKILIARKWRMKIMI
jgi:hypothetical protein